MSSRPQDLEKKGSTYQEMKVAGGQGIINLDSDGDDGMNTVVDGEYGDGSCGVDENDEEAVDPEARRIASSAQRVISDLTCHVQNCVSDLSSGAAEEGAENTPMKATQPEAIRDITLKG